MKHKIGIIGHGFVGLAVETGLQNVASVRIYDKFKDTENLNSVVENGDILFLCLPTPMNEDRSCDTLIIEEVALEINKLAKKRKTIVIKSTIPPGTTQKLATMHHEHDWIFNPEFLQEKNFINDFITQDRIILGCATNCGPEGKGRIRNLYEDFVRWQGEVSDNVLGAMIIECDSREAEMVKYMANCFLATKVTFANEMNEICEAAGIDYKLVSDLVVMDKRIGRSHFQVPGACGNHGFGGSCFPKDINAIMDFARDLDIEPILLDTVWTKNLMIREDYDWEDLAQVTGEYKKDS